MNMKKSHLNIFDEIRQKAEELIAQRTNPDFDKKNVDLSELLHDLEVYQIELELQHEELIKARDRLQISRDKYIELYDFAPIGYLTLDENKKIVRINQTGSQLLAFSKSEITGKNITKFISKLSQDDFYIFYNDLISTDKKLSAEVIIKNGFGKEFFCQIDGIKNANNHPDELISLSLTDISSRKSIESELVYEKNRLELIYRNVPVALITLDENLRITSWNPKSEGITGFSENEVKGHYIYEILKFNYPEKVLFEDILSQGKVSEIEIREKGGDIRFINFRSDKLDDVTGMNSGYIVTLEDITNEVITSQNLKESENRFRSIIEKTPIGMCITDENGLYEFVNPAYCRIYKYTPDELLNQHFTIVVSDSVKEFFKELHDRFINEGEHVEIRGEWEVYDKYGNKIHILADAARIIGTDNRPKKVTFVIDVSEMKKVEANLRKAMAIAELANKSKSEFLANMSHEIRTPLNAILGFSELLKNKNYTSDKYEYYLDAISVAGINLLSLINDILDLSKIEAGKMNINPEPVDILSVCEEVFKIFTINITEKNLQTETKLNNDIPVGLILDEIRIRQILFNLVGNAVKFTEAGKITLIMNFDKYKSANKGELSITVKDTGIGIPENQLDRIFEPFMQTEGQNARKYGGTGLGLPITKRLIEMMNGKITVESSLGEGSEFTIIIKDVEITDSGLSKNHEKVSELKDVRFNEQVVLLVDDNDDNIEIIEGFLKNSNLNLQTVKESRETLEKVRELNPALILLDMQLPGLDGNEICRQISEEPQFKNIPIIALTAASIDSLSITTRLLISGYIRKPFKRSHLITEICKIITPAEKTEINDNYYISFLKFKQMLSNKEIQISNMAVFMHLNKILLPHWETVNNTLIIDRIKDFSKELLKFAENNNIAYLIEYSDYLIEAIYSFDIESLIEILPYFGELAKKVTLSN